MHQYRLRERLERGDQARPWHLYTLASVRGLVFPCHWHPEWELVTVDRGSLDLVRQQSTQRLGPGDVAFLTGTDLHTATSDDPTLVARAFVFHSWLLRSERRDAASARWIEPLEAGSLQVPSVLGAGTPPATVAHRLVEAIRAHRPGLDLLVKGLLYQFLAEVEAAGALQAGQDTPSSDPLPRIRSTLELMEDRFAEPLTVEFLADQAHLSPSHFARLFKAVTGDTPINHLIRRRVDEAARLLRSGDVSVSEAALRVGFSNLSHFSRTFRAQRGATPSEYARNPGTLIKDPSS